MWEGGGERRERERDEQGNFFGLYVPLSARLDRVLCLRQLLRQALCPRCGSPGLLPRMGQRGLQRGNLRANVLQLALMGGLTKEQKRWRWYESRGRKAAHPPARLPPLRLISPLPPPSPAPPGASSPPPAMPSCGAAPALAGCRAPSLRGEGFGSRRSAGRSDRGRTPSAAGRDRPSPFGAPDRQDRGMVDG